MEKLALFTEVRHYLDEITEKAAQENSHDVYAIDDSIRWKDYIAMHKQSDEISGKGIIAAQVEAIQHTKDPNRTGYVPTTSSTVPTRPLARFIPSPNAKTMQSYTSLIRAHALE